MICVSSSGFRCSLLFLALFVASQTLAKPESSDNSTPVSSTATKPCNNMYNNFYAGPKRKIENLLHEMKKQLNRVADEIKISKWNKTLVKGKVQLQFTLNMSQELPFVFSYVGHQTLEWDCCSQAFYTYYN